MEESTKKFLDAAVEKGGVTREQVEEVLRIRETMLEVGVDQSRGSSGQEGSSTRSGPTACAGTSRA